MTNAVSAETGEFGYSKIYRNTLLGLTLVLSFGLIGFGREFSKIPFIGPFFLLDGIAILLACLLLHSQKNYGLKGLLPLSPILIFGAYGLLRLLYDFVSFNGGTFSGAILRRILQHSILFIYPVIWSVIGLLSRRVLGTKFQWVVFSWILSVSYWNFLGLVTYNVSIGPLLAVITTVWISQILSKNSPPLGLKKSTYLFLAGFLCFVTFLPFWRLWIGIMQRTSLLQLIVAIVATPIIWLRFEQRRIAILVTLLMTSILLVGAFILSELNGALVDDYLIHPERYQKNEVQIETSINSLQHIGGNWRNSYFFLMNSLQKGEDHPTTGNTAPFQARFRKACWLSAVAEWKKSPLFGIGFIPEVPEYLDARRKNTGGFEYPGDPPVAGPHNSYLSILARLGIVGILAFGFILLELIKCIKIVAFSREDRLLNLVTLAVIANGLLYGLFNVGLESPPYCTLLWFCFGAVLAIKDANYINTETKSEVRNFQNLEHPIEKSLVWNLN